MKLTLRCSYEFRPSRPTCNTSYVQTAFGIEPDVGINVIADGLEVECEAGQIVLFSGPSGSGKSSLLRAAAEAAGGAVWLDETTEDERAVVDALGLAAPEAVAALGRCGLGEATLMLRNAAQLSDGQRYRFALARCLASKAAVVAADEWCAKLDRVTAAVVSRNARKTTDAGDVCLLLATAHDDMIDDLQPDVIVRCLAGHRPEVEYRRPFGGVPSASRTVSTSPMVPRRTGRTSLGGIIADTGLAPSDASECSGTDASRSVSASSGSGL